MPGLGHRDDAQSNSAPSPRGSSPLCEGGLKAPVLDMIHRSSLVRSRWHILWASLIPLAILMALVVLGSTIAAPLFGIRLKASLYALGGALVFALGDTVLHRLRHPPLLLIYSWNLGSIAAIQFATLFVAGMAQPVGMAVFASFFLLLTAYQGFMNRAAPRHITVFLMTPLASLGAFLISGNAQFPAILLLLGAVGTVVSGIAGSLALWLDHQGRQREAFYEAVHPEREDEWNALLESLGDLLATTSFQLHDMANSVQSIRLGTHIIDEHIKHMAPIDRDPKVAQALKEVKATIEQLMELVTAIRASLRKGRTMVLQANRASPAQALSVALQEVGRQFPSVNFGCPEIHSDGMVYVKGGQPAMTRLFKNLLLHACSRDGFRGTQHVCVRISTRDIPHFVRIVVEDDGPTFWNDRLRHRIFPLSPTQYHNTGICLHSVEEQVLQSGGKIHIGSRKEGGTFVEILLPRALETPGKGEPSQNIRNDTASSPPGPQ